MKLFFVAPILVIAACTAGKPDLRSAGNESAGMQVDTDTIVRDTVFLQRNNEPGNYHAVYIEKNPNTVFYKQLLDFSFHEYDLETFNNALERIHHDEQTIRTINRKGLPEKWLPLCSYRDTFYLNAPADWGSAGRMIISDSLYIFWNMDGPDAVPMKAVKRSGNTWQVFYEGYGEGGGGYAPAELYIHMIDTRNKVAVWEYRIGKSSSYELYVAAETAKNFGMIVNYCATSKWAEFETDEIDFKLLLGTKYK